MQTEKLYVKGSACALCGSLLPAFHHRDEGEEAVFCCKGCQIVYQILKAQGALENYQKHPVYQQALQSGLISNPHLQPLHTTAEIPEADFQKLHLSISNLWCPSCAKVIHFILMREKGVRACLVDYSTDLASIEFTPRFISKDKILTLIKKMGYEPCDVRDATQQRIARSLLLRLIIAAFFSLNVMMFAYPIYATYWDGGDAEGYTKLFAWFSLLGSLPVVSYCAWPIWKKCWTALKIGLCGMETLVLLGVSAATALSLFELFHGRSNVYFDTVTVIIFFVLLGKLIESKAKFSAKDALVKLTLSMPRRGRIRTASGEENFRVMKEIQQGDRLVVKMGEKVVLDGIVEEGSGTCDESLMTGEAVPVVKTKGSSVLAGTLLQQGELILRVTATFEQTALQKIFDMVGADIEHKSRYVRAADHIVAWFVPAVITLALLTAIVCLVLGVVDEGKNGVQTAIMRAVSVLLISCPCAIGIAAPAAEACLLNLLAKMGVLVRNRGSLAFLGRETIFVLDKTGTVTEGEFTVCKGLERLTFDRQRALKGLVAQSPHPIAIAIYRSLLCPQASFEKIEEIVGKGIEGRCLGQHYCLGSAPFLAEQGVLLPESAESDENTLTTTVYFAYENQLLATIRLGDHIRPGVSEFIQALGNTPSLLVSGDGSEPVAAVAKACSISAWYAQYSPIGKKEMIDELRKKGEIVAMLGDGMNDAPALTAAHIGIATATATDFSVQVSDLVMTTKNFHSLTLLRKAAIKGRKIVRQNLFWAFFYNCAGIPLAACGLLTPLFSAFAMTASSLIVLLNALRLTHSRE